MTSQPWDEYESADEYVGAQINQIMFRRGIKRRDLGEVLHTDGPTAGRKLRGERSWTLDELLVVARFLDVDVAELLPGNDYDPVLSGRGRGVDRAGSVRHQGLEPRTR